MARTRCIAALAVVLVISAAVMAQEPIRFARTPDISPDGKLVAFSYLGDIWTVETIGGIARPVTMHEAHDASPVFSPDGRWLAFSSNRHGSYDVFVVPVYGGKPRRLTFDSAADMVNGWSPDGKNILFTSNRATAFPGNMQLFTVPVEGGMERRLGVTEGKEAIFSPQGDRVAYVRGPGTWYRRGYRGSSNDDIWICKPDGSDNQQLTTFNGQDNSPMWSQDGKFIYYVSEYFAQPSLRPTANILRVEVASQAKPQLVTTHVDDSVRRARISRNGDWIVYECGPDIWVVSTREGSPRRLAIEVHADDKSNTEHTTTFTRNASEFALSHDEKLIAFVVHGEIFVMPASGGKANRLTDHPAFDHGIAWAPDNKKIVFTSDRRGQEDLFSLEAAAGEPADLTKAQKFSVRQLTGSPDPELGVSFSPDGGKKVAFLRAGKLWTMDPDGTNQKPVIDQVQVFDYEWSPDGKWLVYARADGSFASELYIIPADGKGTPRNITRYATYNGGVTWSGDGKKLAFISERRYNPTIHVLSLQKPAAPGTPDTTDIDWEDIHLRVVQPVHMPAEEGAISADGNRVAFRSSGTNGDDLWVASSSGGSVTRVTTGNQRPTQIQWSKRLPDVVYFRDGSGSIRRAHANSGSADTIPFLAKMTVRRDEEFREMFEQSWRALQENFYDPSFHGANWDAVREKYRPIVKHVALKEDLYVLVSLMLGELNASHLGIAGFLSAPEENTADLGLIFDESYRGPGLKIAEVLKRGPADKRGLNLKPGEIIAAINGADLTDKVNLSQLLNDKIGETIALKVAAPTAADPRDPKAQRKVEIQGASRDRIGNLMYERWVEHNAKRVTELSKGKLGYIHIPSMDEEGLDRFVRALYSDSFDKEGVVLDVRYNGGGFTHDQVLNYLGAREHTRFRQRHGGEGLVLRSYDRKWTRPLTLLINNRSYSDAEIFPNAFRTLGLGKLVGQPTGGHVIGTSSVRLIDGSSFRVPRTGVFTLKGVNMEKEGVAPDVVVEVHPDQAAKGEDPQLDKAVDVLNRDVIAWKKKTQGNVTTAADIKPTTSPASPVAPPMGK